MKIEKVRSLKVADKVLAQVKRNIAGWNRPTSSVTLRVWSNCREQGYHLAVGHRAVVFAQDRNSDHITLIEGYCAEFDITTNMPSDEAFKRGVLYLSVAAAADHITAIISQSIAK